MDGFLDEAEHRIFEISESRIKPSFHTMPELTRESLKILERLYENREMITGVPSGFIDLDRITAGFQPSDLVIIAARPSMGKTALALNIAAYAAMDADPPVGRRVLLAGNVEGAARAAHAVFGGAGGQRAGTARISGRARFPQARAGGGAAVGVEHLYRRFVGHDLDHAQGKMPAAQARARARTSGLIVVDYLQLMRSARPGESREKEIAEISRSLKALAKELKVPVVALSQLNRQVESRENRRPMLADLRESGAIEQDADVIAFIYREEMYKGKESKEPGVAEVIVAKQRNGPTDTAKLTYINNYTRFENYTPETGVFEERAFRRSGRSDRIRTSRVRPPSVPAWYRVRRFHVNAGFGALSIL